ncbi:DUF547 domain-containing protein [Flavobacterium sp.]|uniref:DUF547 domain-containing protein n=1 Tax=Flavobacterium sp. TaxID=239 RepID=UPI00286DB9BA|nr:DUF547 domain-containing protein [Flavobacterium sp.]
MKKLILLIAFLGFYSQAQSQTIDLFFEQSNEFFKKNVTPDGKIDYLSLKKSPGELMYILSNIEKIKTQFDTKEAAKAFWINAYNLHVIKGVLDSYPIKSVDFVKGFFKEKTFMVGNQELTLDDIENTILREIFVDAGIHFVLSSAANGGAPLLNIAYFPQTVNEQMKQQAKLFINSKNFMRVNKETKTVELPKIFEWYKKDFVTQYFNEIDFLNLFLEKKIDNKMIIKTYDFDWSLNQKI